MTVCLVNLDTIETTLFIRGIPHLTGNNIFHLHIAKTAGTSLRSAFYHNGYNIYEVNSDFTYDADAHCKVDLFSGHAGFCVVEASPALRNRVITILRNPYERVLSYYHHLIMMHESGAEQSERTRVAAKYRLHEFLRIRDNTYLLTDIYNALTWQLVYDTDLGAREKFRFEQSVWTNSEIVARAKKNLSSFLVVGFQDRMDAFAKNLRAATGFDAPIGREYANPSRPSLDSIDAETRRLMGTWIEMDIEIYEWARSQIAPNVSA